MSYCGENLKVKLIVWNTEKTDILNNLIKKAKEQYFLHQIEECEGNQKKLFRIVNSLLGRGKATNLPRHSDRRELSKALDNFFVTKISNIQSDLRELESSASNLSFDLRSALVSSSTKLSQFSLCSVDDIQKVLKTSSKASCHLDPIPTSILHQLSCLVPVITNIVNQSLTAGHFPSQLKSATVKPLLKKSTLDLEIF